MGVGAVPPWGGVVVDTNQVVPNSWELAGPWWAGLLGLARSELIKVVVPQIVSDEIVRHYRKSADEAIGAQRRAMKDLRRLGIPGPTDAEHDVDRLVEQYKERLCGRLRDHRVEIRPAVDHGVQPLLDRLVARRKPFKENGTGLADAVIWDTVVDLARNTTGPVAFITANSSDFGGPELDPQLEAELASEGQSQPVVIFKELRTFIERLLPFQPKLHGPALVIASTALDDDYEGISQRIASAILRHEVEVHGAIASVDVSELTIDSIMVSAVTEPHHIGLMDDWAVVRFLCHVELQLEGMVMSSVLNDGDPFSGWAEKQLVLDVAAMVDVTNERVQDFTVETPIEVDAYDLL